MSHAANLLPFENELPSQFADRLGVLYAKTVTAKHKKDHGQFFTPTEIAHFMARLAKQSKSKFKILDPGCGTTILSSSLIETIVLGGGVLEEIELVVYETDTDILPYTAATLEYLKTWLEKRNINFKALLETNDFVLDNESCFEQDNTLFYEPKNGTYDIVISNPPYFKISKDDKRAIAAKSIVWGQPNIYSIFLITAAKLLKTDGELIFIIPRSFAAGTYFRAFREALFKEVEIEHIHLFNSRTDTFNRDNVLQETLILKGKKQQSNQCVRNILLTHSNGLIDLDQPTKKEYQANELVDFSTKEKILHLPTNHTEGRVMRLFQSWKGNLHKYNMQISTGRVVSFRAIEYLYERYENGTKTLVPLYQLINTGKMTFEHPVYKKGKSQYIHFCKETKSLLLPNKNYIFLRRFSAKDDKSRLVATPYFADPSQAEFIGVENHLNYIYRPNGHLMRNEILGLAALLNSKLFDTYFRTFNGNINVSATELREMPLPALEDIKEIGNQIILNNHFSQSEVDELVHYYLDLGQIFAYE